MPNCFLEYHRILHTHQQCVSDTASLHLYHHLVFFSSFSNWIFFFSFHCWVLRVAQMVKVFAYNAGDPGSIPGSGRSPGEGNGNPLEYSCYNPGVTKSQTQLSDFTSTYYRYWSILRYKLYKYFFPVYRLSFHLLTSLGKMKFFHFDKAVLTNYSFEDYAFDVTSENPLPISRSQRISIFFPPKNSITLYTLWWFEFLFFFLNKARGLVSG